MKPLRSMTTFALYPFAIQIKLQLEILKVRWECSILLRERKLTVFRDIMVELVVWIGPMDYLLVEVEMGMLLFGIQGWVRLVDTRLILNKFVDWNGVQMVLILHQEEMITNCQCFQLKWIAKWWGFTIIRQQLRQLVGAQAILELWHQEEEQQTGTFDSSLCSPFPKPSALTQVQFFLT